MMQRQQTVGTKTTWVKPCAGCPNLPFREPIQREKKIKLTQASSKTDKIRARTIYKKNLAK